MTLQVLQRLAWSGSPADLAGPVILHKGGHRTAVCKLMSHVFGWECQLMVRGELVQSQVCRSQDEVLSTEEQWKAAMLQKGWT